MPASTSLQQGIAEPGNNSLWWCHMPGSPVTAAVGFGTAMAPLTRHHGAGEATAVLPSMWAAGSVPGARPGPAPPAPRAARHWHTAVPTWVGENTIKHCDPAGHRALCQSPPSFGTARAKVTQPGAHGGRRGGGGGENLPAVPAMGRKAVPGARSCSQLPRLVWGARGVLTVPGQPQRSPGST